MTTDKIMDQIDSATAPENMSQEEALEFLENLQSDIDGRLDALKTEIAEKVWTR